MIHIKDPIWQHSVVMGLLVKKKKEVDSRRRHGWLLPPLRPLLTMLAKGNSSIFLHSQGHTHNPRWQLTLNSIAIVSQLTCFCSMRCFQSNISVLCTRDSWLQFCLLKSFTTALLITSSIVIENVMMNFHKPPCEHLMQPLLPVVTVFTLWICLCPRVTLWSWREAVDRFCQCDFMCKKQSRNLEGLKFGSKLRPLSDPWVLSIHVTRSHFVMGSHSPCQDVEYSAVMTLSTQYSWVRPHIVALLS